MTWEYNVDDSAKGRYDIILGRYLLTELGINLNIFKHAIEAGGGPLKYFTVPMIYFDMYTFKDLNAVKITPEEYFMNSYVDGVYES